MIKTDTFNKSCASMTDLEILTQRRKRLKEDYKRHQKRKNLFLAALVPLVVFTILLSVTLGSVNLSVGDIFAVIAKKISGLSENEMTNADLIVWTFRLPRIFMGVLAGIGLGSAGAVMQSVLKNPLADPYILGISSAAGFGASLAIVSGVGLGAGFWLITVNAFVFSLLASLFILLLSGRNGRSPRTMLLTGLSLLFFFQAMTTILQYFGNPEAVKAAVFWTVGDLGKADWLKIAITMPLVLVGTLLLVWKSGDLNVMNAGEESAVSLGVNIGSIRVFTMIVCSLMVSGIVSFTGTIGFIGLVAPHLVRLIIGSDNKVLVPASGLIGAILLVLSDSIARTVVSPVILPVGAVTAFLGVPLFLYLILRKKGGSF